MRSMRVRIKVNSRQILPSHQQPENIHHNYFRLLEETLPETSAPSSGLDGKSFNQGYYDAFFVERKKLGRGQRGSVFLVQHVLDQVSLGEFAVKAVPVGVSHDWLVRMLKGTIT